VPTVDFQATLAAVDGEGQVPTGTARWTLLIDADRRPQGWLDGSGMRAGRGLRRDDVRLGGTLIRPGGTLRSALDAALSSPSGEAVAVGAAGLLVGTVSAQAVVDAIERAREAAATGATGDGPVVGFAAEAKPVGTRLDSTRPESDGAAASGVTGDQ